MSNLKNRTRGSFFSLLQCSFAKAYHSFGAFFFGPCPMAQKMVNGNPLLNQMVLIWGLWFKAWPQNPRFMWLKNFHFHHGSGSPSNSLAVSFHLGISNTSMTSWWFQPIWKICSSNWIISPGRGENKKCLKPPPGWWWEKGKLKPRVPLFHWQKLLISVSNPCAFDGNFLVEEKCIPNRLLDAQANTSSTRKTQRFI